MPMDTAAEQTHYLLAVLSEAEQQSILQACKPRQLAPNSIVFSRGDVAEYFYLIRSGGVRVYFSTPDGREKTIRTFNAPDSFAEAVMFMNDQHYPANAMTTQATTLHPIPIARYKQYLLTDPARAMAIIAHLIRHVQILHHQLEMLGTMDGKERILKYIADALPMDWKNGNTYPLPMSKKDVANYLAIRPETLSRTLRGIEAEGVLTWTAEGVTLLNFAP